MTIFKDLLTGELVDFDLEITLQAVGDYLDHDGQKYKRVRDLSSLPARNKPKGKGTANTPTKAIVSDAMGCPEHQVKKMQLEAYTNGFTDVEWKKDPDYKENLFYQAHFKDRRAHQDYIQFRKLVDRNGLLGGSGGGIDAKQLEQASESLQQRFREAAERGHLTVS